MPMKSYRVSALDDVGDPDSPPGSEPWAKWMLGQAKLRRQDLQRDVTGLQEIIKKLEKHSADKALGFVSFGLLCYQELDLDDQQINLILKAKSGDTLEVILGERGRPKEGERGGDNNGYNITNSERGTNSGYLRARLKRDRPDILAAFDRGEYPSARAAGIAAGIVKVPTPLDILLRAWKKASSKERDEFKRRITP